MTILLPLLALTATASDDSAAFRVLVERMAAAAPAVRDASFVLEQEEYVNGRTRTATLDVRWRKGHDVYVRWLGDAPAAQEMLYDAELGKLRVNPGGWMPTVVIDPEGRMATRNQRHTVLELGPVHIARGVVEDDKRIRNEGRAVTTVDRGRQPIGGTTARCFENRADPPVYAARVEICIDEQTALPVRFTAWDVEDGQERRVERYTFAQLKTDIGLSDAVFEPSSYDF